jgi:small-conductance mechanosensitive channel
MRRYQVLRLIMAATDTNQTDQLDSEVMHELMADPDLMLAAIKLACEVGKQRAMVDIRNQLTTDARNIHEQIAMFAASFNDATLSDHTKGG